MSLILSRDELVGKDFSEKESGWDYLSEMALNAHANFRFVLEGYSSVHDEFLLPLKQQLDLLDDVLTEVILTRNQ